MGVAVGSVGSMLLCAMAWRVRQRFEEPFQSMARFPKRSVAEEDEMTLTPKNGTRRGRPRTSKGVARTHQAGTLHQAGKADISASAAPEVQVPGAQGRGPEAPSATCLGASGHAAAQRADRVRRRAEEAAAREREADADRSTALRPACKPSAWAAAMGSARASHSPADSVQAQDASSTTRAGEADPQDSAAMAPATQRPARAGAARGRRHGDREEERALTGGAGLKWEELEHALGQELADEGAGPLAALHGAGGSRGPSTGSAGGSRGVLGDQPRPSLRPAEPARWR